MKLTVSKILRRIGMVVLLCLIVVLPVTSCRQNHHNEDKTNGNANTESRIKVNTSKDTTVSTEVSDDFFASMENMDHLPTVMEYYNKTEYTVFLKLKITKIYDEVYIDKKDSALLGAARLVMLECSVVKDLYNSGFDIDQKIVLPVFLNQCFLENDSPVYKDLDINDVKSFLSKMDCIYAITRSYINETFIVENNSNMKIHTNLTPCNLSLYEVLPSIDGKLSINQLDNFFREIHVEHLPHFDIYGMYWFCPEGITCTAFEDNVKKLSEYFDNKLNK